MEELGRLLEEVDVHKLLEHYRFEKMRQDGKYIRSACKLHEGDNPSAFVINSEDTLWYCHTGCGGGDAFTLVQKMEGCSFVESIKFLGKMFNVDVNNINLEGREDALRKELKAWMDHNKRIRAKQPIQECKTRPIGKAVARLRNFKKETLEHFGVEFLDSITLINNNGEAYDIHDRLFFPITFNKQYVGFSLRRTKESDIMKWSHQPRDFSVARILYNYDNVCHEEDITVCEGIYDVMACHEAHIPAVCAFGSHLSDEQIKLLLRTGADVTMAFDGDNAGKAGLAKALSSLRNKTTVRQLELPDGDDPESIPREKLREAYDRRKKIY